MVKLQGWWVEAWAKILMSDGVSPFVQLLEMPVASRVSCIQSPNLDPELHPEATKICAKVARVGIALVELAPRGQVGL